MKTNGILKKQSCWMQTWAEAAEGQDRTIAGQTQVRRKLSKYSFSKTQVNTTPTINTGQTKTATPQSQSRFTKDVVPNKAISIQSQTPNKQQHKYKSRSQRDATQPTPTLRTKTRTSQPSAINVASSKSEESSVQMQRCRYAKGQRSGRS